MGGDISNPDTDTRKKYGAWQTKNTDTVYQAAEDGTVHCYDTDIGAIEGLTDGSNPPTTRRQWVESNDSSEKCAITMDVIVGDYWKVTSAQVVFWRPDTIEVIK